MRNLRHIQKRHQIQNQVTAFDKLLSRTPKDREIFNKFKVAALATINSKGAKCNEIDIWAETTLSYIQNHREIVF